MNQYQSDCKIVNDCRNGLPKRQRPHPLRVERYDDGVAWVYLDRLRASKPSFASTGDHITVCANHIDALLVSLLCSSATLGDVVVASQAELKYMRGRALHLAQNRNLLRFLRYHQLVAIFDDDVVGATGFLLDYTFNVDDESTHRLGFSKL